MNENLLTNEALEGKIEYINKLMEDIRYAESLEVVDTLRFIKSMILDDMRCYIMLVDGNLDRLSKEEK